VTTLKRGLWDLDHYLPTEPYMPGLGGQNSTKQVRDRHVLNSVLLLAFCHHTTYTSPTPTCPTQDMAEHFSLPALP